MLVWSRSGRLIIWVIFALIFGVLFLAPLAVILLSSLADQWNGVLPNGLTTQHYADVAKGAAWNAVKASLVTGFAASALALVSGTWAALSLRLQGPPALKRLLGLLFFIPSAVPSVSVGLGLLVAFSHPPLLLN
ncbi:MAG: phosphonate ABC transporter permease, partial [Mesorhizobium sp.]